MGYDDNRYRDEEGEPIMDPDMQSDREISPEPADEDWGHERSPSPAFDSGEDDIPKSKPRKRLIKKSTHESSDEAEPSRKRKSKEGGSGEMQKKKKLKDDGEGSEKRSKSKSDIGNKLKRISKSGGKGESSRRNRGDTEMKEMWDTIAGDSEDDQEGPRTNEDDAFIDDTGVDPHERFGSDDEAGSIGDAPQAEEGEDEETGNLFKPGKKKKKGIDRTPEETAMLVEQFMAKLEVAAEEDADLNRQSKPAVNKLKMLSDLTRVLSKRQLQQEFLDRGILSVLKNWLEPLPDGCLPNLNVRTTLLKILTDLPIDVEQYDRKEQLKKSGLGKVIMFLSRSDEEIQSNRKIAKDLVDKWSRPIFQKSTRYEDMRGFDEERVPYQRLPKKPASKAVGLESRDDDLDLELSQEPKPGKPGQRQPTIRPEAIAMDFVVRPQSKIDPEEIRARAKQQKQDERRAKMNKKLQQLKAPKKKKLQATKISVEGRGMVKYF